MKPKTKKRLLISGFVLGIILLGSIGYLAGFVISIFPLIEKLGKQDLPGSGDTPISKTPLIDQQVFYPF